MGFRFTIAAATLLLLTQTVQTAFSASIVQPNIEFYTASKSQKTLTTVRYFGEKTIVHIDCLSPKSSYTITATLNYGTQNLMSTAVFESDTKGVIDTDSSPATSGTYTGVDADGLFWSMSPEAAPVAQAAPTYQISVSQNANVLQSVSLAHGTLKPGVQRIDLTGTGLVGALYLPKADGPRPAVITYSGSEGGVFTGEVNAGALANQGFVALGLGYFGAPDLPNELANIPLEYFQKAIQYLQSRSEVRSDKIAVMGPSRGGELSLLLGATFPEIKAVVAMVPSPMRWGANDDTTETDHPNPAWTFQGNALPFLEPVGDLVSNPLPDGRVAYSNRPAFEKGMQDPVVVSSAMSAIERTNGPVLLLGADDDQVWPSCVFADIALKYLHNKSHPFKDQKICYANAGHTGVSIPGLPTVSSGVVWDSPMNMWLNTGGTPAGNAHAQRGAWTKILEFLSNNLK